MSPRPRRLLVPDTAYALAAMRAGTTHTLTERDRSAAEATAARLGRRVVEVGRADGEAALTLGFADGYEPNPIDTVYSVRRLPPIPLVAFACCLGCCWPDTDVPPYPGQPTTVEAVVELATSLGARHSHLLGALRNDLTLAGLVVLDGHTLRLGPALAAWPDAQVAALRRLADSLPRAHV
jgi:hypothetical protein